MFRNITWSKLFAFIFFGASICSVTGIISGYRLSRQFLEELRERELSLVFGSIESGPVAFARLHSAAIAQTELENLMNVEALSGRSFYKAIVSGGPDGEYVYAAWQSQRNIKKDCLELKTKKIDFDDAINPIFVELTLDRCIESTEARRLKVLVGTVFLFFMLVILITFFIIFWPILSSIRISSKIIQLMHSSGDRKNIPFVPIRDLTNLAFRGFQSERDSVTAKIAEQVSHDIRSPLSALEMLIPILNELSDEKRIILRNSASRIRDIANTLKSRNVKELSVFSGVGEDTLSSEAKVVTLVSSLIDLVISEKRIEYKDYLELDLQFYQSEKNYGLFIEVQPAEFKRVISNLLNNAIESYDGSSGNVSINVYEDVSDIAIEVVDRGKGIPKEVLKDIGTRGVSYDKPSGTGIGLYHAINTVSKWGGVLLLESDINVGTKVIIRFPKKNPAPWFPKNLIISQDTHVVILDDDQSVREAWQEKIESKSQEIFSCKIFKLSTPAELRNYYGKHFMDLDKSVFLIDFELIGHVETGLSLIQELGIQKKSFLVTSYYEDLKLQDQCMRFGIALVPKQICFSIPLVLA